MWLELAERFAKPILDLGPKIPGLVLTFIFGYIALKVVTAILRNTLKIARFPKALANIVISLVLIILWVIFFSELAREAGLGSLAVKISGSLLVLGLAIANGASAITGDMLAGFFLAKDCDFDVGYRVRSGDIEGTIEKIDVRKTRVRDNDGCLHVIPNSKFDSTGWKVIDRCKNGS